MFIKRKVIHVPKYKRKVMDSYTILHAYLKWPIYLQLFNFRLCDEATSALDSSTEAEILTALRSLANNRTAVFVAHRLTTAMQCDEASPFFWHFGFPNNDIVSTNKSKFLNVLTNFSYGFRLGQKDNWFLNFIWPEY